MAARAALNASSADLRTIELLEVELRESAGTGALQGPHAWPGGFAPQLTHNTL